MVYRAVSLAWSSNLYGYSFYNLLFFHVFICLFSTVNEIAVVECVGFCSNVDEVSFHLEYDTVSCSR